MYKQVQHCGPGDIAILPPGVPHHYATPEGNVWEFLWVHFVPIPEWRTWLQLPRSEENMIYFPVRDDYTCARIKDAFLRLIYDSMQNDNSSQQLAMIALSEVLALIHRQCVKSSGDVIDERIERVLQHLAEHLQEPQPLRNLAALADMSVSRLCHLFKDHLGETVIEKLNNMRLIKASRMLELTSRKIQDISFEVGFESPYYFTRKFSQQFGMSPTEFRKKTQKKWLYKK